MRPLALGIVLLMAAGCGGTDGQAASGPTLDGTPWVLVAGVDVPGWREHAPSARFADGKLSGSTGCNRYSGSYRRDGDALELGSAVITEMACPGVAGEVERAFIAAKDRVAGWRIEGTELVLTDGDGRERLRFAPASPVGTWEATMIRRPGAVESLAAGTRITAEFTAGGRLSGSAGCNPYEGTWREPFVIADLAVGAKACAEPAGVAEQEADYLDALGKAAGYRVEGSTLTLLTRAGTIVATYTRAG